MWTLVATDVEAPPVKGDTPTVANGIAAPSNVPLLPRNNRETDRGIEACARFCTVCVTLTFCPGVTAAGVARTDVTARFVSTTLRLMVLVFSATALRTYVLGDMP